MSYRNAVTAVAVCLTHLAAVCIFGCESSSEDEPNFYFELDGVPSSNESWTPVVYIDNTKESMGPNSALSLIAFPVYDNNDGSEPTRGEYSLWINIPHEMSEGEYSVGYADLPHADKIWVSYRKSPGVFWTAYEGTVNLEKIGEVGETLSLSFKTLKLTNECGDERVLSNGRVIHTIGSEDSHPQVDYEMFDVPKEAFVLSGNAAVFKWRGKVYGCGTAFDIYHETLSEEYSNTGNTEETLVVDGICACDLEAGTTAVSLKFRGTLPHAGNGKFEFTEQHSLSIVEYAGGALLYGETKAIWQSSGNTTIKGELNGMEIGESIDVVFDSPVSLKLLQLPGDDFDAQGNDKEELDMLYISGILQSEPYVY